MHTSPPIDFHPHLVAPQHPFISQSPVFIGQSRTTPYSQSPLSPAENRKTRSQPTTGLQKSLSLLIYGRFAPRKYCNENSEKPDAPNNSP